MSAPGSEVGGFWSVEELAVAGALPGAERELGARGSRSVLDGAGPADGVSEAAGVVLASVPAWWEKRAEAAGLTGRWLDVYQAIAAGCLR